MKDEITLEDIQVYGHCGCTQVERDLGQRLSISLRLFLDFEKVVETDSLEKAVNYVAVYEKMRKIAEDREYQLIESLAYTLAKEILESFPIEEIEVKVCKPCPPVAGHQKSVSVKTRKSRASLRLAPI